MLDVQTDEHGGRRRIAICCLVQRRAWLLQPLESLDVLQHSDESSSARSAYVRSGGHSSDGVVGSCTCACDLSMR